MPVFATSYLPPVEYFKFLIDFEQITIEQFEHFQKQTIRNRCFILSPNGIQCLSIPLIHTSGTKQVIKDLKISYEMPWQRIHWRSFLAAYNRSPFFEYYQDDFNRFYHDGRFKWLVDFNLEQLNWIIASLKKNIVVQKTDAYLLTHQDDYRQLSNAKTTGPAISPQFNKYNQVFNYKFGFTGNLSIIDLIFNTGGRSADYLANSLN